MVGRRHLNILPKLIHELTINLLPASVILVETVITYLVSIFIFWYCTLCWYHTYFLFLLISSPINKNYCIVWKVLAFRMFLNITFYTILCHTMLCYLQHATNKYLSDLNLAKFCWPVHASCTIFLIYCTFLYMLKLPIKLQEPKYYSW